MLKKQSRQPYPAKPTQPPQRTKPATCYIRVFSLTLPVSDEVTSCVYYYTCDTTEPLNFQVFPSSSRMAFVSECI